VAAGGRGRTLLVVGSSGWPSLVEKLAVNSPSHSTCENRVGHFGPSWSCCGGFDGYPWWWRRCRVLMGVGGASG